ncbi:hypothetical protein [Micromonospora sp. NPDC047730]|uniref:hypothetical protein n=1 Tax=Micromonospora sp. NPDC047730 TaxID=3364253 RepID=UPI003715C095
MATTSVYALPYQTMADPPHGPDLGRLLAEKVETELVRIDADVDRLEAPVIARLRQTTPQTLTTGTFAPINFQTEDLDSADGHSTTTNISRYTAKVAGKYELSGAIAFAANGTGQRYAKWQKNGVDVPASGTNMQALTSGQSLLGAATVFVTLAVNDYVQLLGNQLSGANLDTYTGVDYAQSAMNVRYLGK